MLLSALDIFNMKKVLSLIFCIISPFLFAQQLKEKYATSLTNKLAYFEALPVWEELATDYLSHQKGKIEYIRNAANTAFKCEQYLKAFYWDSILVAKQWASVQDYEQLFDLANINQKQSQLSNIVEMALKQFPKEPQILLWKNKLPLLSIMDTTKSDFEVKLLRPNSKAEEFAAIPYKKGILFVTTQFKHGIYNPNYSRTNQNFTEIAYIENLKEVEKQLRYKNKWKEIDFIGEHDGPVAFSKDFKKVFVTRNQAQTDTKEDLKLSKLELVIFNKKAGKWEQDFSFTFNKPDYSIGHAAIDTNKNLIFASDMPGGFGGTDLYQCNWLGDHWSAPVNLGSSINTSKDELFPYVSAKGYLYFASNGWPGLGGLDIFRSDRLEDEPEHLGLPINSNGDDFALNINEETGKGYLSSNRNQQKDQLYELNRIVLGVDLEVKLQACSGRNLPGIPLVLKDKTNSSDKKVQTNSNGIYQAALQKGHQYVLVYEGNANAYADSIVFQAKTPGHFQKTIKIRNKEQVNCLWVQTESGELIKGAMVNFYHAKFFIKRVLTDSTGKIIFSNKEKLDSVYGNLINYDDAHLSLIKPSKTNCLDTVFYKLVFKQKQAEEFINLKNIYYSLDKSFLRPESKIELDKLVKYLKEHPDLKVELSSHTDSRESAAYNIALSKRRSNSCVRYIIKQGVSANQIIAKGYGESQLVNRCSDGVKDCTEEEHQQNRRTELRLLGE